MEIQRLALLVIIERVVVEVVVIVVVVVVVVVIVVLLKNPRCADFARVVYLYCIIKYNSRE